MPIINRKVYSYKEWKKQKGLEHITYKGHTLGLIASIYIESNLNILWIDWEVGTPSQLNINPF